MKLYLSHAMVSTLCGVMGMLTFAAVTREPVGASPAAVTVSMTDNRFAPAIVHVQRGRAVTWRNTSQLTHTVTGSGFDSGNLEAGATWSHTFGKAGTYEYWCQPHRAAGMVAKVIVDP